MSSEPKAKESGASVALLRVGAATTARRIAIHGIVRGERITADSVESNILRFHDTPEPCPLPRFFPARRLANAEQTVRLSVKLPRAHLFLCNAYRLGKRYHEAEASYRAYLADQPAKFEILVALADAIASQARADRAITLLEQALVLSSGHADQDQGPGPSGA